MPPGKQRQCHLSIALTAAERALLDERAALADLRPAVYLRQAALAGAAAVDRRVDLTRLHVELRRIGNNLNQIAHAANSALAGDEYPAARAAVASVEGALAELRAALAAIRSSLLDGPMIGKIIKGKGFGGAVRYAMQKDDGAARLIGTNLVADRNDADALAAEMAEHAAMLRPDVEKAVQHVSLSAAPGEHLTDEQWQRVAAAYMEKMGFRDNQYVLVRHADTGHDHVHLIMNRVSMSGDLVSTQFDYRRQEIALDQIEREHDLTRTHEQLAQEMREHPEKAIDILLRDKTSFTERDLRRHLWRGLRDETQVDRAVKRVLEDERCLVAGERAGAKHYTSREVLSEQAELRDSLGSLLKARDAEPRDGLARDLSESTPPLSAEQRAAVESITGERHLSVVSGYAGAGKSTMLAAARQTWEQQGKEVYGCALAGKAAKGLQESSGIASDTLAKRLKDLEGGGLTLTRDSVVVVDEAGMVENRQMAKLAQHCDKAGAALVLVGDDRQLRPIGRGGAFNTAREMAGETAIESVRRQRLEWQREASKAFGRGEAKEAVGAYAEHGRVEWAASRGSARQALVRDYAAAVEKGRTPQTCWCSPIAVAMWPSSTPRSVRSSKPKGGWSRRSTRRSGRASGAPRSTSPPAIGSSVPGTTGNWE